MVHIPEIQKNVKKVPPFVPILQDTAAFFGQMESTPSLQSLLILGNTFILLPTWTQMLL